MKKTLAKLSLFIIGSFLVLCIMSAVGIARQEQWISLVIMNMVQGGFSFVRAMTLEMDKK